MRLLLLKNALAEKRRRNFSGVTSVREGTVFQAVCNTALTQEMAMLALLEL